MSTDALSLHMTTPRAFIITRLIHGLIPRTALGWVLELLKPSRTPGLAKS